MKNIHNLASFVLVTTVLFLFASCATQPADNEVIHESSDVPFVSTKFPLITDSWSLFDLYSGLGIGMYDLRGLDSGFSIYVKTETAHGISEIGEPFSYSPFEGYFEGHNDSHVGDFLVGSSENQNYNIVIYRNGDEYILSVMDDSIFEEFLKSINDGYDSIEQLIPFIRTQVRLIQ